MRPALARHAGFTLIELLMVLAVAGLLMAVAAPNFVEYRRNSELADATGNLVVAAGSAKSAALKTGRNTFVQANDNSVGWKSGWFVYVDNNWNNSYDEGTDDVVMRHDAISSPMSTTPSTSSTFAAGYLMYNGAGFPTTKTGGIGKGAVTFATTTRSTNVIIDTAGRARTCRTGTTGCTAM